MNASQCLKISGLILLLTVSAQGGTLYVDLNSPVPTPPYTNWATAASVIQDAIEAAEAGDEIVVTNGVYDIGGLVVYGTLTNRVAVTKPLILRSVNGPEVTAIKGYQVPGITNGLDAVRCVYLTNGAVLSGFTLTNGATEAGWHFGGGAWCESTNAVLTNCVLVGNCASQNGGASFSGTLIGCVLSDNVCFGAGGGSDSSVLINCHLVGNFAGSEGGGAMWSELYDSTLVTNAAGGRGGGTMFSYASNCTYQGNSAEDGGGAAWDLEFLPPIKNCTFLYNVATFKGGGVIEARLDGCSLIGNVAAIVGGGAHSSWLTNCLLLGNSADLAGGAAYYALVNCTIVSNTATTDTGGVVGEIIRNCVIYHNSSPNLRNYDEYNLTDTLGHCCTEPIPTTGVGNFTNLPLFIAPFSGNFRLQSDSSCIGAGNNSAVATPSDRDGRPRMVGGNVDVGAYEFQSAGMGEFIGWLESSGLPTDGSADLSDTDGDGMNNWGEWRSDSIPTNALSVLRLVKATNSPTGAKVTWQSVSTRNYWLDRATNLGVASPFESIATNIAGVAGITVFTDTTATNGGSYFYRVGVQ